MKTIRAKVNPRLLAKADRLFTGSLSGRIIELLQNARRAGATEVRITNRQGQVTVHDNGRGVEDFSALLDLGRSGWEQTLEQAEDPAGVGIFCLAPRRVQISSGESTVIIANKGWTGEPVEVHQADARIKGASLVFEDEPWTIEAVEKHAVFTGLKVIVDGQQCAREAFVSDRAAPHPELGCKIEVRERDALSEWHGKWKHSYYADDVLVNFHGQVVLLTYAPVSEPLQCLVDLTGEPTGIRLMLPARTQLVENEALGLLKAAIEKEAYRHIQQRGCHRLKFSEYCRAKELGIELPEAQPVFRVGLLTGEPVEPVAVVKPAEFPLSKCYRMGKAGMDEGEQNEANAHLLSALGKFDEPFVVVDIQPAYEGYNWAKLATVERVEVKAGKQIASQYLWCEILVVVESLEITAYTSEGKTFTSAVPMALRAHPCEEGRSSWVGTDVLVTTAARDELEATDIWFHLGGWSEDGDTYDTQLAGFEEQLNLFWATVVGPGEYLRLKLLECIASFDLAWKQITIESSGKVWVSYKDGTAQMLDQRAQCHSGPDRS